MTLAPASANRRARPCPRPLPAPVTIVTLPVKSSRDLTGGIFIIQWSKRYPGRSNRCLREVPQDLNSFRDRLSSGQVHADEDGRVLGWINRDPSAESRRSSVLHNHRMQVGIASADIVHPGHR